MLEQADTVVAIPGDGIYAFAGDSVWRYTPGRHVVDVGYPRAITAEFPGVFARDLDAALLHPDGDLYLFRGPEYLQYDLAHKQPRLRFPRPYAADWPGVFPNGIDAALTWSPDVIYLFSGDSYTSFSPVPGHARRGFPKAILGNWPGLRGGPVRAAMTLDGERRVLLAYDHYQAYDRDGRAIRHEVHWPLADRAISRRYASGFAGFTEHVPGRSPSSLSVEQGTKPSSPPRSAELASSVEEDRRDYSAVMQHESPFRTGIPNALKFDSKLWDAFQPTLPLLKVNPGFADLEDAAIVIVALSDDPKAPRPYVGHDAVRMFYSGSMLKMAAMYAAFQLRAALNNLGPSLSDGSDSHVFKQVSDALDPQIKAAVPRITAARGITPDMLTPKYAQIFTITHGTPVKFDFTVGPDDSDETTAKPASTFLANLKRMIVGSHNNSATVCIRALGYNTINGALQSAGLFTPNTQNGIWLAGDYAGWQVVTVDSVNDGQVKQATTCVDMARLLVLINDGNLVEDDVHSHPDGANLEMRLLLEKAVTDLGARSLLLRPFEPDPTSAPFKVLQSKIGVGELKGGSCRDDLPKDRCTYSEAAVVQHSSGRKFVVVFQNLVLFKAHPAAWGDGLRNIVRVISETMDAYH